MSEKRIPQYFDRYESYEEYQTRKNRDVGSVYLRRKSIEMSELLDTEQLFIVGEPGYGKSTLMNALRDFFNKNGQKYLWYEGISYERIDDVTAIEYLLFDALDENANVIPVFNELVNHCNKQGIKLIISNRNHYINSISHLLAAQNFQFIELQSFDSEQISKYLENCLHDHGYEYQHIYELIEKSKANSQHSILRVPRYLAGLCSYIVHDNLRPKQLIELTRSQLFDKVFYYKLDSEDQKKGVAASNYKLVTKRVMERLALLLEMQHLNVFTKEDFITFLDQADSNMSLILLNTIDLDDLLKRVLKSEGELLRFEHTEFQEFLAAKEIVRLGNRFQTVDDLMIDHDLHILPPNWADVLSFVIDLDAAFVSPLLSFIKHNKYQFIDHKLIEIVLSADHTVLYEQVRADVFSTCFNYYIQAGHSAFREYGNLANFFTTQNESFLTPIYGTDEITPPTKHIAGNQFLVIEALSSQGRLPAQAIRTWTDYLSVLALKESSDLVSTVFYTLNALNAAQEVLEMLDEFEKKEDHYLNFYLNAVSELNANDPKVVDLIIRCLAKKRRLSNIERAMNRLTSEEAMLTVFKAIIANPDLLRINDGNNRSEFNALFKHIEAVDSKKLDDQLRELISVTFKSNRYGSHLPAILMRCIGYMAKKDAAFLSTLTAFKDFVYALGEIAGEIVPHIDLKTFQDLENAILREAQWRFPSLLHKARHSFKGDPSNPIMIYLDQTYPVNTEAVAVSLKIPDEPSKLDKLRPHFLYGEKQFFIDLIPNFVRDFDDISSSLNDQEIQYITQLIDDVLKHYKPEAFSMEITDFSATSTSFTHNHDVWFQIELYFKAAFLINRLDIIQKYRDKFLKSLPRMDVYSTGAGELLREMLEAIMPLTQQDIDTLYEFCVNRQDDLLLMSVRSFAESIRFLKLRAFKPLLLAFISNPKVKSFEQEEALQVFGELSDSIGDKNDLETLFNDHLQPGNKYTMAAIANAWLIRTFSDIPAIDWRFGELKRRLQPFDAEIRYSGARKVSAFESEIDRPEFPKCLYGLDNPYIKGKMHELLIFSFDIRNNYQQFTYSNYLQRIVYEYFKAIISLKDLDALKMRVAGYSNIDRTYSFTTSLHQLQMELYLLSYRTHPFIDAVKQYNHLLSTTYLPIASSLELKETIVSLLKNEIVNLVENEGFYRVVERASGKKIQNQKVVNEELIQKTLKIALEKLMLAKGFRSTDIYREVQSYDDLKYDYLVKYGLYGPVMVELKLLHNDEIQNTGERNDYRPKLEKYLKANNNHGIYAVFQTTDKPADQTAYHTMVKEYSGIEGLEFVFIKCY